MLANACGSSLDDGVGDVVISTCKQLESGGKTTCTRMYQLATRQERVHCCESPMGQGGLPSTYPDVYIQSWIEYMKAIGYYGRSGRSPTKTPTTLGTFGKAVEKDARGDLPETQAFASAYFLGGADQGRQQWYSKLR